MGRLLLSLSLALMQSFAAAQSPVADFSAPVDICLGERIMLSNTSVQAARYSWDFCEGDLAIIPNISTLTEEDLSLPVGTSLIQGDGKWYGFITNINSNSIMRVNFGESLSNLSPTLVDLGTLSELVTEPQNVKVVESERQYYIFINNRKNNKLIRINLGSDIENTSVSTDILATGSGFINGGMDVVFDGTQWIVYLTNRNSLTRIEMGSSLGNAPVSIATTSVISEVDGIGDIKLVKHDNQWYGFIVGYTSRTIHRLDFGSNLSQDPVSSRLSTPDLTNVRPYGLAVEYDNKQWILFSSTNEGNFLRLKLGNEIVNNNPEYEDLGKLGQLKQVLKFDIAKSESRWVGLATNWNSNDYFLLNFPQSSCPFNQVFSARIDTVQIAASTSGMLNVSLYSEDANGLSSFITKTIEVSDLEAPNIAIANTICFGSPIQLSAQTNQPLTSVTWTINNEARTGETIAYDFPTPGTYEVALEVESTNGCGNRLTKEITIYEPPAPNFTAPAGQICTNGAVGFTNTTDAKGADVDSLITYQWFVDDELVSEEANPDITFANGGDQTVRLEASIPGCTEITEQTVSVLQGPTVNFNVAQICQGDPIAFENLTTGDGVTGYAWDFGDGGTFSSVAAESPTYTFTEAGTYTVALRVDNTLGCQNIYQQEVTVFEQPSVGFVSDVACVGTPTQFTDTTTAGVNANVIAWQWDFGDNLGTAAVRNPTYAYPQPGTYDVRLTTQTTAGCTDAIQKTITVESPVTAGFAAVPQCPTAAADYRILFSDTSLVTAGDEVTRWFWTIGEASFVTREVEYSFPGPGDYEVSLTAFAASGCNAIVRRTVRVDSLPALDFTADASVCTSQTVAFRSAVNPFGRAITEYAWSVSNPAGEEVSTAFEADPSFVFEEPGIHEVTLSVSTEAGCTFSRTQSVAVVATPSADFTATPARGGAPLLVNFAGASVEGTEYQWDFGGVNSADEASPTFTFNEPGSYTVTLTARNEAGCESTTQQTIEVLNPVQDVRLESLSIVDNPNGPGQRLLLTVRNVGSLPADSVSVTINFGDAVSVQEGLPEPLLAGETRVYVTRFQLPASTSTVRYLCATLRVDDVSFVDARPEDNRNCASLDQQLTVEPPFPNPAADRLQVPVILPEAAAVSLRLTDLNGKVMQSYRQADAPAGLNTFIIRTKGMPVGTYLLQIDYQGEQRQFRVSVAP